MGSAQDFLNSQYGAKPFFYLLIEGIGVKEGDEAKQLYAFTRVPNWSPTSTQKFVGGLGVPGSATQSGDLWGGMTNGGALELFVQDRKQTDGSYLWCDLFATGKWVENPAGYPQCFLQSTLAPTEGPTAAYGGKAYTTNHDAFPSDSPFSTNAERTIHIGLETIRYQYKSREFVGYDDPLYLSGFKYSLTGLTRGLFPCVTPESAYGHALEHRVSARTGTMPAITTHPRVWINRMAAVYLGICYPDGTYSAEGDCMRLFVGPISDINWVGKDLGWRIQVDDLVALAKQRTCCYWIGGVEATTVPDDGGTQDMSSDVIGRATIRGIHMPGAPGFRVIIVDPPGSSNAKTIQASDWYPNWDEMRRDLHAQAVVASDANHIMSIGLEGERFYVRSWSTSAGETRCIFGRSLAMMMGYSETVRRVELSEEGAADEQLQFDAEHAFAIDGLAARDSEAPFRLYVRGNESLIAPPQGDGVDPRVMVGGKWLMRYADKGESYLYEQSPMADNYQYITATPAGVRSQPGDYGANVWPAGSHGVTFRYGDNEKEGTVLRQVFAPNPDRSWGLTLRSLLLSTGYGIHGAGGADNLPRGIGAGIWPELVDHNALTTSIDYRIDSALTRRSHIFDGSFKIADLLDTEGKFVGVMWVIKNGKLTPRLVPSLDAQALYDALADSTSVPNFTQSNKANETDRTGVGLSRRHIINHVKLSFNYWLGENKFLATSDIPFPVSQDENKLVRGKSMEVRGLYGDWYDTLAEPVLDSMTNRQHLYGWPLWTFRRSNHFLLWGKLAPGDIALLTDGGIPDHFLGTIGMDRRLVAITDVSDKYGSGDGECSGIILNVQSRLKVNAAVAVLDDTRGDGGWDSTTRTMYLKANEYTTAPDTDRDSFGDDLDSWVFKVVDTSATNPDGVTAYVLSHPTLSTQYTNGITLVPIVDEGDLDARLPGGFVNGHRYVVTPDHYYAHDVSGAGELPGGLSYDIGNYVGDSTDPTDEAYIADGEGVKIDADHPTPWDPYS